MVTVSFLEIEYLLSEYTFVTLKLFHRQDASDGVSFV